MLVIMAEPGRPQMAIWSMRFASWIPKTTNTHSEYVILISFSLQKWLRERTSILWYVYIGCLDDCCRLKGFDAAGSFSE